MRALLWSCLFTSLATAGVWADDPVKSTESPWQNVFRRQAAEYRVTFDDDESQKVEVSREPILFWSQPVRGGDDGGVFLWTSGGRPVAIGTFFIWPPAEGGQAITHELHSLSEAAFTADWKGRRWTAPAEAIRYQEVTATEPLADSAERRLLQFKKLARRFSGTSHSARDDRDWELRLLPRPLYRYEPAKDDKSGVLDGVVFGLVQGTDLEIVLLLEAVKTGKAPAWRWSAARMSDLPLSLKLDDKEVWQVEKAKFDDSRAAYFCGSVAKYKEPPQE